MRSIRFWYALFNVDLFYSVRFCTFPYLSVLFGVDKFYSIRSVLFDFDLIYSVFVCTVWCRCVVSIVDLYWSTLICSNRFVSVLWWRRVSARSERNSAHGGWRAPTVSLPSIKVAQSARWRCRAQGDRRSKRRSTPIDELDGEQCCSPRAAVLIAAWWLMALWESACGSAEQGRSTPIGELEGE